MQHKLEEEIAQEQAGFRPKRGTTDQIVNLRIILEKARERNQPLYLCFIDFGPTHTTMADHARNGLSTSTGSATKESVTYRLGLY